jgi:hypothetical protein
MLGWQSSEGLHVRLRNRISAKQGEGERSLPATSASGPAWSSVKDGMCFQGDRTEGHEREAKTSEKGHETNVRESIE